MDALRDALSKCSKDKTRSEKLAERLNPVPLRQSPLSMSSVNAFTNSKLTSVTEHEHDSGICWPHRYGNPVSSGDFSIETPYFPPVVFRKAYHAPIDSSSK